MKVSQELLPESFRPLLWSYDFEDVDPSTHKRTIITQAINYGTLAHWRWLVTTYGKDDVRHMLTTLPVTSFRKHVRKLISVLFSINEAEFNHASRGTDTKRN